jgi:hypothetical protein
MFNRFDSFARRFGFGGFARTFFTFVAGFGFGFVFKTFTF